MAVHKPSRRMLRALRAQRRPDDENDARKSAQARGSRWKIDRKTQQLGRQVAETLAQALAGLNDDVLQSLYVVAAEPAPNASRFVITVSTLPSESVDPIDVLERLDRASSRLRAVVAGAITRKRAPLLVFHFAVPSEFAERRQHTV